MGKAGGFAEPGWARFSMFFTRSMSSELTGLTGLIFWLGIGRSLTENKSVPFFLSFFLVSSLVAISVFIPGDTPFSFL